MASARPRLWVTARLQVSAPGQATTSRASSAPGSAMPMAVEPVEQRGQLLLGEAAEDEVLAVGDATSAPSSRWIEARARNCCAGDVAEAGVGVGATRCPWPRPARRWPRSQRSYGSSRRIDDRRALADRRGPMPRPMPAGSSPPSATASGMPPGHDDDASRNLRSLRMRACSSSQPIVSTSHLMRARSLLSRLPWLENTRRIGLERGHQLLAGRELLEGEGRVRVGAEAAGDEHPEAGLDGAVVVRAADGDDADVVEHGLAAVGGAAREVDLELAGQALGQRVAQEVLEGGLGPRADVERLVGAGAGEVAAHDVADGVAARLRGREPDRRRGRA